MRVLAALAFVAVLSCATAAAPNSLVRHKRALISGGGLGGLGGLGNILDGLLNPVLGTAGGVLAPLQSTLGNLLQSVSNLVNNLLAALQELIQHLTGLLREAEILDPLADVVDRLVPTVNTALEGVQNGLTQALQPVVDLVYDLICAVFDTVEDANIPLVSEIVGDLGRILDGVFQTAADLLLQQLLETLGLNIQVPNKNA